MLTANKTFNFNTKNEYDYIDITDEIINFMKESGIKNGLVNIQTLHTTAPLIVNENEPLLIEDLRRHLENLSPKKLNYRHDDFTVRTVNMCSGECANGHSHCKAVLLLSNATFNLIGGKMQLGQWQRVMLWELDRSRPRKVQVQILGE